MNWFDNSTGTQTDNHTVRWHFSGLTFLHVALKLANPDCFPVSYDSQTLKEAIVRASPTFDLDDVFARFNKKLLCPFAVTVSVWAFLLSWSLTPLVKYLVTVNSVLLHKELNCCNQRQFISFECLLEPLFVIKGSNVTFWCLTLRLCVSYQIIPFLIDFQNFVNLFLLMLFPRHFLLSIIQF